MEDDPLVNAITYVLLLRVKSFPKMYVTLRPPKWYHSPPLAHALKHVADSPATPRLYDGNRGK